MFVGVACAGDDAGDGDTNANVETGSTSDTPGSSSTSAAAPDTGSQASTGAVDSSGAATDASTGAAGTDTGGTSGGAGSACFPEGIYGSCADNPDCQCLQGANVYAVCTQSCTEDAQCGDAADFPGATPGCFPLNPGSPDMICALVCVAPDDCPCGLSCMPSGVPNVNICSELQ